MAHPADKITPKTYPVEIAGETYNLKFRNLAIVVIEKEWGSLQGFLNEFAKGENGRVMTCLYTVLTAGLAHSGFRMDDIDRWDLNEIQEAMGPITEAFWDAFARPDEAAKDESAGEAPAADEAA